MQRPTPMIFWQDPVPAIVAGENTGYTEGCIEISITSRATVHTKDTSINFIDRNPKKMITTLRKLAFIFSLDMFDFSRCLFPQQELCSMLMHRGKFAMVQQKRLHNKAPHY